MRYYTNGNVEKKHHRLSDYLITVLCCLALGVAGCDIANDDPPEEGENGGLQWYKGNLHTHSYWSLRTDDYPEMVVQWYKSHGYDFLAMSEHNTLADSERWMDVKKGTPMEEVFQEYLNEFGDQWVDFVDRDSVYNVRLKRFEEYRDKFEQEGEFLLIQSEEIHDNYQGIPVHLNVTNIQELIEPGGGDNVLDVLQNNINAVVEQRESLDVNMIPHVSHPNIDWAVTTEDLKQVQEVRFFEVYNGHLNARNYGDSLHSGTEQKWDEVNTFNLLNGKPLMYGLAVDDAHNYHNTGLHQSNPGGGWIQVRSSELSPDSLMAAMQRGNFYASTGVRLSDIQFDGNTLSIKIEQEGGVHYTTQFIGTREDQPQNTGVILAEEEGVEPSYTFTGNELFVRAKVVSDKPKENPNEPGAVEVAWVQPKVIR